MSKRRRIIIDSDDEGEEEEERRKESMDANGNREDSVKDMSREGVAGGCGEGGDSTKDLTSEGVAGGCGDKSKTGMEKEKDKADSSVVLTPPTSPTSRSGVSNKSRAIVIPVPPSRTTGKQ